MCREELGSQVAREGPRHAGLFFVYDFGVVRVRPSANTRSPLQSARVTSLGIDTGRHVHRFRPLGPRGLVGSQAAHRRPTIRRARFSTASRNSQSADTTDDVVHGSTVATNAVLERKGARVALVATAGFEDVVRIGRQTRPELYNIFVPLPRPLVEPGLTFGVSERLDAAGACSSPLDDAAVDRAGRDVRATRRRRRGRLPAAFLRESRARAARRRAAARAPGWLVSASSRSAAGVSRVRALEHDGRERVRHAADRSLSRAARSGARRTSRLSIMQSNGGSISAARRARAGRAHGAVRAGGRRRRRARRRARPPGFRA